MGLNIRDANSKTLRQNTFNQNSSTPKVKLWDENKPHLFAENLNQKNVNKLVTQLDEISNSSQIQCTDIDSVVSQIETLFISTAESSFGYRRETKRTENLDKPKSKPWFNRECRGARDTYHNVRKLYNKHKTPHLKNLLKDVSKTYKVTIAQNSRKFRNLKIDKLKNLKFAKPKAFWKIINSVDKKKEHMAPLNDLYEYFKSLNEEPNSGHSPTESDWGCPQSEETRRPPNNDINVPFTEKEIITAVKNLKNNKSQGLDNILNEQLKSTIQVMSPIYVKLFNIIFDTGLVPESWAIGNILPIFKNKGNPNLPENYRPITLLSCFGKLFTSILNTRITQFLEDNGILNSCQAGFRKGFSTSDNLFIIQSLIEISKTNKKKLFCAFIDFKQAFDKVWRDGLWHKLQNTRIDGKCLRFIQHMYQHIKSRISTLEGATAFFPCQVGVRQGENLSPIMFLIFLNDLESFLRFKKAQGITISSSEGEDYFIFLKLFILLFADDTVLLSNSKEDLQFSLNLFEKYCEEWKLQVNTTKTKILIFSGGRIPQGQKFIFKGENLEIVNEYKYLGIFLTRIGAYQTSKKHIADQANKALFSLLRKIRTLDLPIYMQIDLFDKTVKPILLYGSEIWGFGNLDIIERVQLKFFKHILNMKKTTPSFMVYGELGQYPLYIDIYSRIISFWTKLGENGKNEILWALYRHISHLHEGNKIKSKWYEHVKQQIFSNGFGNIWALQNEVNGKWFTQAFKQKLKDQYMQTWHALVDKSSSSVNYRTFKVTFEMNNYFSYLSNTKCKTLTAFRTRNHRLPVEVGRWSGIPLNERLCWLCKAEVGDEFHYLLKCTHFKDIRPKYIKPYFMKNPNVLKFNNLMNSTNKEIIRKLTTFIDIIIKNVKPSNIVTDF